MKGLRAIILAGIMAALATFIMILLRTNTRLHEDKVALEERLAKLELQHVEREPAANSATNAVDSLSPDQMSELLRLRGQVGSLKKQVAELSISSPAGMRVTPQAAASPSPADSEWQRLMEKQQWIAKMTLSRNWMMAFLMYADEHQGQFPSSYDQAAKYLLEDQRNDALAASSHFEIVFQGSIAGLAEPSRTIVLRETDATQFPDGSWSKTYAFADGHGEVHKSADGNFGPWENERMQKSPRQ